ncbi:hypothetical protein T484DRAFT_1752494 [Baffinella frigidus]|nr:hypothetical protein T484DRAFT_1752494 [Cryptophyta sp. CCMP2293]
MRRLRHGMGASSGSPDPQRTDVFEMSRQRLQASYARRLQSVPFTQIEDVPPSPNMGRKSMETSSSPPEPGRKCEMTFKRIQAIYARRIQPIIGKHPLEPMEDVCSPPAPGSQEPREDIPRPAKMPSPAKMWRSSLRRASPEPRTSMKFISWDKNIETVWVVPAPEREAVCIVPDDSAKTVPGLRARARNGVHRPCPDFAPEREAVCIDPDDADRLARFESAIRERESQERDSKPPALPPYMSSGFSMRRGLMVEMEERLLAAEERLSRKDVLRPTSRKAEVAELLTRPLPRNVAVSPDVQVRPISARWT